MSTRPLPITDAAALLSPHDVASVLGVSESTVKRWVDLGRLAADRTGGGHRRVHWAEVLRFAAEHKQPLLRGALATTSVAAQVGPFRAALAAGDDGAAEVALARAWAAASDAVTLVDTLVVGTWTADRTPVQLSTAARTALAPLEQRLRRVMERLLAWTAGAPSDAPVALVGWTGNPGDAVVGTAFATILALTGFRVRDLGANLAKADDQAVSGAAAVFLADPWGPLGQPLPTAAMLVEHCRAKHVPCLRTSKAKGGLDWRDAVVWAEGRCLAGVA